MQFPVLYSRTLLFIHSTCNSLHLPTPNFQSIPLPPPLPLGNHKSVLYICQSVSVSQVCSYVLYFRFHTQVISFGICLSLSDLLAQHDNLQVHPCCCKWHYFILFLWLSSILDVSIHCSDQLHRRPGDKHTVTEGQSCKLLYINDFGATCSVIFNIVHVTGRDEGKS